MKILDSEGSVVTSVKSIDDIYAMLDDLKRMENCGNLIEEIGRLELLSVREEQKNRISSINTKKGWLDKLFKKATRPSTSSTNSKNH